MRQNSLTSDQSSPLLKHRNSIILTDTDAITSSDHMAKMVKGLQPAEITNFYKPSIAETSVLSTRINLLNSEIKTIRT